MSLEIMLDLETLSTENNAAIISIGAVKFDPRGVGLTDRFEVYVAPEFCPAPDFHISGSTVMWWMHEDRAPGRKVLLEGQKTAMTLMDALFAFTRWFGHDSIPVWGNGATFDNVIMRHAMLTTINACPWAFYHDRCYRTLKALHPEVPFERIGVYHSAVDDAASQALHLQQILRGVKA